MRKLIETFAIQTSIIGGNAESVSLPRAGTIIECAISFAGLTAVTEAASTGIISWIARNQLAPTATIRTVAILASLEVACGTPATADVGATLGTSASIVTRPFQYFEANVIISLVWSVLIPQSVVSASFRIEYD